MDDKAWMETRAIALRHDAERADDLAQDLALAALENRGGARRLGAWLERVGRNAAIDRWRVERRRRELACDLEPPVAAPDPEAALLGRERRQLVRRALGALPRPQRRAALVRFHADLPFEEVALRLGTPVVTARTRVHRALAGLRARLGGLRVWFIWPGAHATALGLTLLATSVPPAVPSAAPVGRAATATARTGTRVARRTSATPDELAPPVPVLTTTAPVAASGEPARPSAPPASPRPPARATRAAPAPSASSAPTEPQRFVFGDDLVDVDIVGPEGEWLEGDTRAAHASLIEIRRQFVAEVLKSLEDL